MIDTRRSSNRIATALAEAVKRLFEALPGPVQQWVDNGAKGYWAYPNRAHWLVETVVCGWIGHVWEPLFRHDRGQWPVELLCWNCAGSWASDDPQEFEPGTRAHRDAWAAVGAELCRADDVRTARYQPLADAGGAA